MSPESHQLLNFLAKECQTAMQDGDKENADKFWNLLDKHLRNVLQRMFLDNRDQQDLLQEASMAIYRNIGRFNSEKASFQTWAKIEARSAMAQYLRKTGYSRTIAEHKNLIAEKLQFHFKDGPAPGQSWLDLAREHQEILVSLTGLSSKQVSNTIRKWSMVDASDIEEIDHEEIDEKAFNVFPSRFSWEALEVAMNRLESKAKNFLIQKYVSGMSYAEIAEKYNFTKTVSERPMKEDNARQIVSKACKTLRNTLDDLDPDEETDTNEL